MAQEPAKLHIINPVECFLQREQWPRPSGLPGEENGSENLLAACSFQHSRDQRLPGKPARIRAETAARSPPQARLTSQASPLGNVPGASRRLINQQAAAPVCRG